MKQGLIEAGLELLGDDQNAVVALLEFLGGARLGEAVWGRYGLTLPGSRPSGYVLCSPSGPPASLNIAFFFPPVVSVSNQATFSGETNPEGNDNTLTFVAASEGWYRITWEGTVEHGPEDIHPFSPVTEPFRLAPGLHWFKRAPHAPALGRTIWTATIAETEVLVQDPPGQSGEHVVPLPSESTRNCPDEKLWYRRHGRPWFKLGVSIRAINLECGVARGLAARYVKGTNGRIFEAARWHSHSALAINVAAFHCRNKPDARLVECVSRDPETGVSHSVAFSWRG